MSRHQRPPAQTHSSADHARSKPASRPPRSQPVTLHVINPNAAGIDVHADMHMVCVPADRVPPATTEARRQAIHGQAATLRS